MDIKRILAPTDFSPSSLPALDYAIEIASRFDSRIDVLNVWELPVGVLPDWVVRPPGEPEQAFNTLMRNRAGKEMENVVSDLRRAYDDVHGRLEVGDPASQIVQIAKRESYDLIVMGTHGRTGFAHLWAGSVAERVVRLATCPVLTVRSPETDRG